MSAILHRTPPWRPLLHPGMWRLPAALAHLGGTGRVLLTFDDGPSAATARVARLLENEGARAAFFLVGRRLPEDPSLPQSGDEERALQVARDLLRAGHLPALHGLAHRRLAWLPPALVRRELAQGAARLAAATGFQPIHQRPPYGSWNPWLSAGSRRMGLEPVFWSLNPFDYRLRRPDELIRRVLTLAGAGDILLLHCTGAGQDNTLAALPVMLEGLRRKGLQALDPMCLVEGLHG